MHTKDAGPNQSTDRKTLKTFCEMEVEYRAISPRALITETIELIHSIRLMVTT